VGGAAPRDRSISQQLQVAGIASIGVLSGARSRRSKGQSRKLRQ
jgi:hypothetical protein